MITGATGGMGCASAFKLASLGANLILTSRSRRALSFIASRIKKTFPERAILIAPADIRSSHQMRRVISKGVRRFGPIDLLINFAGYNKNYPKLSMARPHGRHLKTLEDIVDVDLLGTLRMVCLVEPTMRRRGRGMIFIIGNSSLLDQKPDDLFFQIAKSGGRQLTLALARQHKHDHVRSVRIYFLAPGLVHNRSTFEGMTPRQRAKADREGWLTSEHVAEVVSWLATARLNRPSGSTVRLDARTAPRLFREAAEKFIRYVP